MIIQNIMKKPILAIGILMLIILFFDLRRRGIIGDKDAFIPASCKSVLVKLKKRTPDSWEVKCEGNNLAVSTNQDMNGKKIKDLRQLKTIAYRELANNLILIAKNSPLDSLERVFIVRYHLEVKNLTIDAVTEGKYIVKLATLTSPKFIGEHLKNTVQVKENID